MKKFFALAMAAAMIASMAAVSFAAVGSVEDGSDSDPTVKYESNKAYYPIVDAYGPLTYDADDKGLDDGVVEYGETAYYILAEGRVDGVDSKDDNGKKISDYGSVTQALVTDSETVSSLKVKASWEEGKNLVKDVSVVKKKVNNKADATFTGDDDDEYPSIKTLLGDELADTFETEKYYYFVAIATNSSTSTADADIIGSLTLSKSKHPKVDDLDLKIDLPIGWSNTYNNDNNSLGLLVEGDVGPLKSETYYALKFNADEEVDIEFSDDSIFTVDVSGQGKLLLYYDTKFNSKIAAKYPLAELNFWNGNGAKFNRVGEMFIPVKEDYAQFLYQLNADGTLSEVAGAEYDEYDEGFYFNTRVLGTYVISDMELELKPATPTTPVVDVPTTPTTPAPVVTNPSTGAAA